MSFDLSRLTPAPWVCPFDGSGLALAADGSPVADCGGEVDAEFCALARNAMDVQIRRRWWSEPVGNKWRLSKIFRYLVEDDGEWWSVAGAEHADPLTPLTTSDAWFKANCEKESENVP
jgi:hypothetical protein